MYGNTKKIAETVAKSFDSTHKTNLLIAGDVTAQNLKDIELLIVGTPTQGGRPTEDIQEFLDELPMNSLQGTKVAAFDTRFSENGQNFALRMLLRTVGYAAPRIIEELKIKGGNVIASPEGFIVSHKEGPLAEDELKRAGTWAARLLTL
jgi:flavodoxin